jgi:hypothetical protein
VSLSPALRRALAERQLPCQDLHLRSAQRCPSVSQQATSARRLRWHTNLLVRGVVGLGQAREDGVQRPTSTKGRSRRERYFKQCRSSLSTLNAFESLQFDNPFDPVHRLRPKVLLAHSNGSFAQSVCSTQRICTLSFYTSQETPP